MLLILVIPAGLTATFGRMVGNRRQGWAIYGAMARACSSPPSAIVYAAETNGTPAHARSPAWPAANLEGKEHALRRRRLGAVRGRHDRRLVRRGQRARMESLTGLGGAVPLANIMTGEVIFGGVGSGLYGMLLFVLLGGVHRRA